MTMRRLLFLICILAVLFTIEPLHATGILTVTRTAVPSSAQTVGGPSVIRYKVDWTSSAGGAVSGNPLSISSGRIIAVKFVPGSAGAQPTDGYSVTLSDDDGVDLLNAQASSLSNSAGKYFVFSTSVFIDALQKLDLKILGAGNAKSGSVYIWVQ
jgi:hypothetical protein